MAIINQNRSFQFRIPYTFEELQTKAIKEINPVIQRADHGDYLIAFCLDGEYYFRKVNNYFILDHWWAGDIKVLEMIDEILAIEGGLK